MRAAADGRPSLLWTPLFGPPAKLSWRFPEGGRWCGSKSSPGLVARRGYNQRQSPQLQQGSVGSRGPTCRDLRDTATDSRNSGGYRPLGFSSVGAPLMSEVTGILSAIEDGDPGAAEQLLP